MHAMFVIGGIQVEVEIKEVWEVNGPANDELVTTFTAVVEGKPVSYSTSQLIPDYATARQLRDLFDAECSKYSFLTRHTN